MDRWNGAMFVVEVLLVLVSHIGMQALEPPKKALEPEIAADHFDVAVAANNDLAVEIYRKIVRKEENAVFSPLSLSAGLALTYSGAAGITESQMSRLLHFGLPQAQVSKAFGALLKKLETPQRSNAVPLTLKIANSLWVQTGQPLLKSFESIATEDFHATVQAVDFASRSESARSAMNNWARQSTQGRFRELVPRSDVTRDLRMMLLNTLYLRGKWKTVFEHSLTRLGPFFPYPSKTVTTPMMSTTGIYPYLREREFSVIELPYDAKKGIGPQVSMFILLPHETYGLAHLEAGLTATEVKKWLVQLKDEKVALTVPKFTISNFLSLKEPLEAMGMDAPFSKNADFSEINGAQNLLISKILQKVFISIDEKGSEAAAATAVSLGLKSTFDARHPISFVANHPFMFLVIDKNTAAILFIGHVVLP